MEEMDSDCIPGGEKRSSMKNRDKEKGEEKENGRGEECLVSFASLCIPTVQVSFCLSRSHFTV